VGRVTDHLAEKQSYPAFLELDKKHYVPAPVATVLKGEYTLLEGIKKSSKSAWLSPCAF
jgi:hypothetical protein